LSTCILEIAGRVVVRSEGGAPDAEYALFDTSHIELRATEIGAVREAGYRTTAGDAAARLASLGVDPPLVEAMTRAAVPLARTYARGTMASALAAELDPGDLLDGYVFDATSRTYEGLWMNMRALAADLAIGGAGVSLQAIALAGLLARVPPDAEVALRTLDYMRTRRTGERSYRRPPLQAARVLAQAMVDLAGSPVSLPAGSAAARPAEELARVVRERWIAAPRLERIVKTLEGGGPPSKGPLADPLLWSIEVALTAGETRGIVERLDRIEEARGRHPTIVYLRSKASLLMESEPPQVIAERLTELAMSHAFPELSLLAAQAWVEAGEPALAAPFARDILATSDAAPKIRETAQSLLAVSPAAGAPREPEGRAAGHAPGGAGSTASLGSMSAVKPRGSTMRVESAESYYAAIDLEWRNPPAPSAHARPTARGAPAATGPITATARASSVASAEPIPAATREPPRPAPKTAQMFAVSAAASRLQSPPEAAEALAIPPALDGQILADDAIPKTIADARVLFTLQARALGREYRERYNVELRTDVVGLELIQASLRERFPTGSIQSRDEVLDARRHGAFLSEMLIRRLGAAWSDIEPKELAHWTLRVAAKARAWPFARVLQFVQMMGVGEETDLVAYYLDLEGSVEP